MFLFVVGVEASLGAPLDLAAAGRLWPENEGYGSLATAREGKRAGGARDRRQRGHLSPPSVIGARPSRVWQRSSGHVRGPKSDLCGATQTPGGVEHRGKLFNGAFLTRSRFSARFSIS